MAEPSQPDTPKKQTRSPKISKKDLDAAEAFLSHTAMGRRLQEAEAILTLLARSRLPRIKTYLFGAGVDIRQMDSDDEFQSLIISDEMRNALIEASRSKGYIQVSFEKEQIRFTLFYGNEPSGNELVSLYARTIGEVTAVTYAILGLGTRGTHDVQSVPMPNPPTPNV
ncbi:hypothetical protein [Candidatus Entotheonella palauensis]|uniref:hypothetical protein n=1 Tax=Candidatus Entotheonella palauensis TaxID=93172 RepID=UPI000B7CBB12|nr:hypothetical protein [Candidatus Entotheonella palauensis]